MRSLQFPLKLKVAYFHNNPCTLYSIWGAPSASVSVVKMPSALSQLSATLFLACKKSVAQLGFDSLGLLIELNLKMELLKLGNKVDVNKYYFNKT